MEFRGLEIADAGEVSALFAHSDLDAWPLETVADLLRETRSVSLAAFGDTTMAGMIFGSRMFDQAEIYAIIVDPDHRRTGLGRKLVQGFCDLLRTAGVTDLHLEVAVDNTAALALYRKLNFEETGRRPRYYSRPVGRVDALVMTLRLTG
jgi:ribosomal-protein-alanine N-acetyltransferase